MTRRVAQKPRVTDFTDLSLQEVINHATPHNPDDLPKTTRAVLRLINPGNDIDCSACGDPLKFAARERRTQVIANVYNQLGEWAIVKTLHPACYEDLGEPFGPAVFGGVSQQQSDALAKCAQAAPIVK